MNASHLDVRGVSTHVQRLGRAGAPQRLLFIHGMTGNMASWYYTIGPILASDADVTLYDVRGHGMSERPATNYTIGDLGADVAEIARMSYGAGKAILVANSFGGLIAMECAMHHPERVAGLILIDSLLGERDLSPLIDGLARSREQDPAFDVPPEAEIWFGKPGGRKRAKFVAQLRGLTEETTLLDDLAAFVPYTPAQFASLAKPVLGLYGGGSELLEAAQSVFARLPHARLEIVEGSGHALLWEQSAVLSARIAEFGQETAGVAR
jgi:pimeloyl-ACP methyl ester carboxylesterase